MPGTGAITIESLCSDAVAVLYHTPAPPDRLRLPPGWERIPRTIGMYYEITHYAIARSVRFGAVHRCDGKKVRKSVEEGEKLYYRITDYGDQGAPTL